MALAHRRRNERGSRRRQMVRDGAHAPSRSNDDAERGFWGNSRAGASKRQAFGAPVVKTSLRPPRPNALRYNRCVRFGHLAIVTVLLGCGHSSAAPAPAADAGEDDDTVMCDPGEGAVDPTTPATTASAPLVGWVDPFI